MKQPNFSFTTEKVTSNMESDEDFEPFLEGRRRRNKKDREKKQKKKAEEEEAGEAVEMDTSEDAAKKVGWVRG
jgi:hypothetical protein